MKKLNFNLTEWPAKLYDFEKSDNANEKFSRGKLAVFYKGLTADNRYFSDEFAEELIKSLPYTPIVSHYNAETKDFEGHASEQNIYGIVDPTRQPTFEKMEDGNVWAVCDTVYYTERPDSTGDIAKQIEGHSQSLEMTDVQYTINYDSKRHFKNIEFNAGKFIGVSVLGKDQAPAFTGSSFFSCGDKEVQADFESKMKILKDYCEHEVGQKKNVSDGGEMEKASFSNFIKLYWGDISERVDEAIRQAYAEEAYTCTVDFDDTNAYVCFYSYIDGSKRFLRIEYTIAEDGTVNLGDAHEVHRLWEDVPEKVSSEMTATEASEPSNESGKTESAEAEEFDAEAINATTENATLNEETGVAEEKPVVNAQVADTSESGNAEEEPEPASDFVEANTAEDAAITIATESETDPALAADVPADEPKPDTVETTEGENGEEQLQQQLPATEADTGSNTDDNQPTEAFEESEPAGTTQTSVAASANGEGGEPNDANGATDANQLEQELAKLKVLNEYLGKLSPTAFEEFRTHATEYKNAAEFETAILKAYSAELQASITAQGKEQEKTENFSVNNKTANRGCLRVPASISNNNQHSKFNSWDWVLKSTEK